MKPLSLVLVVILAAIATISTAKITSIAHKIVKQVNSNKASTWTAEHNKFSKMSIEELKRYTSVKGFLKPSFSVKEYQEQKNLKLGDAPAEFDSRQKWPNCIHLIRNQLHCGSWYV